MAIIGSSAVERSVSQGNTCSLTCKGQRGTCGGLTQVLVIEDHSQRKSKNWPKLEFEVRGTVVV